MALYRTIWRTHTPIRSLTVTAGGLLSQDEQADQISFLPDAHAEKMEKYTKVERAMDTIRTRYGWHAVDAAVGFYRDSVPEEEAKQEE